MLSVTYNPRKNNINITSNYADWKFKILTDDDIYTERNNSWNGDTYDVNNSHNINDIISNNNHLNSPFCNSATPYVGGLNLQPIRKNIFIHRLDIIIR